MAGSLLSYLSSLRALLVASVVIGIGTSACWARPLVDTSPGQILAAAIDGADRVTVRESLFKGARVLFESAERHDLNALREAVKVVVPPEPMVCACLGGPVIELYSGSRRVLVLENHHGESIACDLWVGDAPIVPAEPWLAWFEDRGMPQLRKTYESHQRVRAKARMEQAHWMDAMPKAMRAAWSEMQGFLATPDVVQLEAVLAEEEPIEAKRILALFALYGSGAGPWTGYPSYEDTAAQMLNQYPAKKLIEAVGSGNGLSPSQMEGVARLLSGWHCGASHVDDEVPRLLQARLLEYCSASDDPQKRNVGICAFGDSQ